MLYRCPKCKTGKVVIEQVVSERKLLDGWEARCLMCAWAREGRAMAAAPVTVKSRAA